MGKRDCKRCKGKGICEPCFEGDTRTKCHACGATGFFIAPDETEIRALITATRGKNKGKLKTGMNSFKTPARAYYVWRMARFHGGADTTMPIMAGVLNRSDPFEPELDALADVIAKESFGSNMAAALRWGRALGL